MRKSLLAGAALVALGMAGPAVAGNIVLTGHDDDYHYAFGDPNAGAQLKAIVSYARAGSTLPVLAIDAGTELTTALTKLGIAYVAVTPSAVTSASFNHSLYSAFVVASVSTCGGCDNPVGTGTQLAKFSSSIASFFDAGGGIVGLAGATDPKAYAYVPDAAGTPTPIEATSGFTATAAGTSNIPGFVAVNGDESHNIFAEPGTGGVASFYQVAERYGTATSGNPITLFGSGTITCTGSSCTIGSVPEPATFMLLGAGLFGLAAARRLGRSRAHDGDSALS